MQGDSPSPQGGAHPRVAPPPGRSEVLGGHDLACATTLGHRGEFEARLAHEHHEGAAERVVERAQGRRQIGSPHGSDRRGQPGVDDEDGHDRPVAAAQSVEQGQVVGQTQIATEPEDDGRTHSTVLPATADDGVTRAA